MSHSPSNISVLLARLDGFTVGFAATAVHAIVRAVAIAPLSGASDVFEGVINFRGRIVPVVDLRLRLALPPVAVDPTHFLVALQLSDRLIAVRVDDVEDVAEVAQSDLASPSAISPLLEPLEGVAATPDGAIVIYDPEAFLSRIERESLDLILAGAS